MNNKILEIFKDFEVDGVKIPVKFLKHKGNEETYITFTGLGESPAHNYDDECKYTSTQFDFDIYTKCNYLNILKAVKQKLKENNFNWIEDSNDMYEEDTGYFHKVTTFEIENYIE